MSDSAQDEPPLEAALELVGRAEQLRGQTVHAGVELGVIDLICEDSKSLDEIVSELGLSRGYTHRLLRVLTVYGLLEERTNGAFSLTPVGERFRADYPESVQDYLQFFYDPTRFAAVRQFPDIVVEGGPTGSELEFGKSMFELFVERPAFSEKFNGMQALSSLGETEEILETLTAVEFSDISTVCDVGGEYGDLICHLLARHPRLNGLVLESPSVVAQQDRLWAPKLGVEDRCTHVGGAMFESVPRADSYIHKAILHDWSNDDCVDILSNIHEAPAGDGRLFVRERIVSETDPDPATIDMDMGMMLETGGRERTRAEFEALFERADWALDDVLAVEQEISIMDCSKA